MCRDVCFLVNLSGRGDGEEGGERGGARVEVRRKGRKRHREKGRDVEEKRVSDGGREGKGRRVGEKKGVVYGGGGES